MSTIVPGPPTWRIMALITQPRALLAFGLAVLASSGRGLPAQTAPPAPAAPANPSGGIIGRIVNLRSHSPIRDAHVALLGTARRTAADTDGLFTVASLPAGTYVLQVRADGYEVTSWIVPIEEGQVLEQAFELPLIVDTLTPIIVEGRRSFFQQRMQEFNERRETRRGVFVTEEEIRFTKAATLVDVLRGIPGVRISCRMVNCVVEMTRSARGVCRADWVVDGFPATESSTPHLPTVGVVAMEVYRSPGETPPQFLRTDSQCGVIVIWTKSGP